MYPFLRTLLFRLDPERAHALTLHLLRFAGAAPGLREVIQTWFKAPDKPVRAFGLTFKNPVGLAAGYDKDGAGLRGLALLGFGHIELGTVTPLPQPGNPKPRLFRLPEDRALINRMGFPSRGDKYLMSKLSGSLPESVIIGINLGKNQDTPLERASQDYLSLLRMFAPLAGYLAINVSSPNTPGLRQLQAKQPLKDLLGILNAERNEQEESLRRRVPLLVKLSPDLTDGDLEDALEAIQENQIDGVIAANTTVRREGLRSPFALESGGLSGAPLRPHSNLMVRRICQITQGQLPVVGAGGVMTPSDAQDMFAAGAVLVQIYTGLVYRGPGLVADILRSL